MTEQEAIEAELIQRELSSRQTMSPQQSVQQPQQSNTQNPIMSAIGNYFQNAQPAFKLAISQPQTFLGMPAINKNGSPMMPDQLNQQTNQPWSDIYRNAALKMPFAQSTSMAGQMVPEAVGMGLDLATRPSSYIAPYIMAKGATAMANNPMTRRFLQTQLPTFSKPLIDANPMEPIYKMVNGIQADITKPLPPDNTRLVGIGKNIVSAINDTMDNFGDQYKNLVGSNPVSQEEVLAASPSKFLSKIGINPDDIKTTADVWQARTDLSKTMGNPQLKSDLLMKTNLKESQIQQIMGQMKALVMNKMPNESRDSLDILDNHFENALKSGRGILKQVLDPKSGQIKTDNLSKIWGNPGNEGAQDLFTRFGYFNDSLNKLSQAVQGHVANQARNQFIKQALGIGTIGAGIVGLGHQFIAKPIINEMKKSINTGDNEQQH